ncbi:MAG: DUF1963 domain-containing protein [Ruminococcus sp.]|nr:DUF1963 domain-containing protein [Ruminococcus sp.]MCM1382022.1 DUF1963 domain-containing protein [Muribaculaceae bacterium]MCM1479382.1 DUF1963 domain-containing protein [Muribaculaceae bacterium]
MGLFDQLKKIVSDVSETIDKAEIPRKTAADIDRGIDEMLKKAEDLPNNLFKQLNKLANSDGGENKEETPENTPQKPEVSLEEILGKINETVPPKPMVRLTPKRAEGLSVFESKLGGVPYMPADFEYPKGVSGTFEGRPLRLLAQLNFEKLPHIEDFPQKGILQFFCSDDEEECAYGINFDSNTVQDGFRVIYHENIITDESRLMPKESMPAFADNGISFPFTGEFLLEAGQPEMCRAGIADCRFQEALLRLWEELTGEKLNDICLLDNKLLEQLYDRNGCENTCIGGYPFFTQTDPRGFKQELAGYGVLLFQSNSVNSDEIMWGDFGIGNFFITESDLKNLDFSKVAYTWDCG